MSEPQIVFGILIGILVLILFVSITTFIVYHLGTKKVSKLTPRYLGRLENTDASIQQAMNFLELTNSITKNFKGK